MPWLATTQLDIATTKEEAQAAFASLDDDGNGYVSMEEFVSFFKRRATDIAEKEVGVANRDGDSVINRCTMLQGVVWRHLRRETDAAYRASHCVPVVTC